MAVRDDERGFGWRVCDAAVAGAGLLVGGVLLVWGLGDAYPWGDEAETMVIGWNVLRTGIATAWDGTNLFCSRGGAFLNERLWQTGPWLQYYAAAAFMGAFGKSVVVGRLPFALASLASLVLFYAVSVRLTGRRGIAAAALGIVVLSVPFLLFGKQARYYGLVFLASMLMMYAWVGLDWGRRRSWVVFSAACVVFFHSHYLTFGCFVGALLIATLAIERDWGKAKAIVVCLAISLVFTLPWFLYVGPHGGTGDYALVNLREGTAARLLWWHFREYSTLGLFPAVMAVAGMVVGVRGLRGEPKIRRGLGFVAGVVVLFTILLSLLSPQKVATSERADIRYALPVLPLLALLVGGIIYMTWKRSKGLAAVLIVLVVFTDVLTLAQLERDYGRRKEELSPFAALPFRSYLADYVYELTHDYTSGYEAAIEYLKRGVSDGEMVLAYDPFSLMLYFGERLRFAGQIDENDERLLGPSGVRVPAYVYSSQVAPDWIVSYGEQPIRLDIAEFLRERGVEYSVNRVDVYGRERSRPELWGHTFRQITPFAPEDAVVILRRGSEGGGDGGDAGVALDRAIPAF